MEQEDRLVYAGDGQNSVLIHSCKGHYTEKINFKDQTTESSEVRKPLEDIFREAREIQAEKNIIRENLTDKSARDKNKDDDFLLWLITLTIKNSHRRIGINQKYFASM